MPSKSRALTFAVVALLVLFGTGLLLFRSFLVEEKIEEVAPPLEIADGSAAGNLDRLANQVGGLGIDVDIESAPPLESIDAVDVKPEQQGPIIGRHLVPEVTI